MNKEEKEILEKFRNKETRNYEEVIRELKHKNITDIVITRQAYIEILVNLIDKLQKENEELKNDNLKLLAEISDLKELIKGN